MKIWRACPVVCVFWAASLTSAQIPGLFNPKQGLESWNAKLSQLLRSRRLTSFSQLPRLNVVTIGHSIEEGVQDCPPGDDNDGVAWRYSNLLRVQMRSAVYGALTNGLTGPPSRGGVDFIPAVDSWLTPILAGPGSYIGGQRSGSWTDHRFNDVVPGKGACRRYMESAEPGSEARFYHFGETFDKMLADLPTSVQLVYQQIPGGGLLEVSWTDFFGAQTYGSFVLDCNSPDGLPHYGLLSQRLPVTDPRGFWVRIKNVSPGNEPVRWEGVNFCSNDETWGIHVTNYACGGATADAYLSDANIEALANASPDVIVLWFDYTDMFGIWAQGVPHWRASLETVIQRIQSRMPGMSILLKLGYDPVGGPWPIWDAMQAHLEQLAITYRCALFSHHVYASRASAEQFCIPIGIKEPLVVHFNRDPGQPYEANLMKQVLLWGFQ